MTKVVDAKRSNILLPTDKVINGKITTKTI